MSSASKKFSRRAAASERSIIRKMLELSLDPSFISFAGGDPDPAFFPNAEIKAAIGKLAKTKNPRFLQYGITDGNPALRKKLSAFLNSKKIKSFPENLIITTGSQQALDLIGKLFLNEGDAVAVENPTYLGAINAFKQFGAKFLPVSTDDDGLKTDALRALLLKNKGGGNRKTQVKFLYTIPDYQNPTGSRMSLARRRELIKIANEFDLVIVEDSPYYFINFDGEFLPTLAELDKRGRVIYLGSSSKMIAPALRLGWISASAEISKKLVALKQTADVHSSEISQTLLLNLLNEIDLEAHLKKVARAYERKAETAERAIKKYFPKKIKCSKITGGFFIWITLPKKMSGEKIMQECFKKKVTVIPGKDFFVGRKQENTIRLSYATMPLTRIEEGIKILGEVLRSSADKQR